MGQGFGPAGSVRLQGFRGLEVKVLVLGLSLLVRLGITGRLRPTFDSLVEDVFGLKDRVQSFRTCV